MASPTAFMAARLTCSVSGCCLREASACFLSVVHSSVSHKPLPGRFVASRPGRLDNRCFHVSLQGATIALRSSTQTQELPQKVRQKQQQPQLKLQRVRQQNLRALLFDRRGQLERLQQQRQKPLKRLQEQLQLELSQRAAAGQVDAQQEHTAWREKQRSWELREGGNLRQDRQQQRQRQPQDEQQEELCQWLTAQQAHKHLPVILDLRHAAERQRLCRESPAVSEVRTTVPYAQTAAAEAATASASVESIESAIAAMSSRQYLVAHFSRLPAVADVTVPTMFVPSEIDHTVAAARQAAAGSPVAAGAARGVAGAARRAAAGRGGDARGRAGGKAETAVALEGTAATPKRAAEVSSAEITTRATSEASTVAASGTAVVREGARAELLSVYTDSLALAAQAEAPATRVAAALQRSAARVAAGRSVAAGSTGNEGGEGIRTARTCALLTFMRESAMYPATDTRAPRYCSAAGIRRLSTEATAAVADAIAQSTAGTVRGGKEKQPERSKHTSYAAADTELAFARLRTHLLHADNATTPLGRAAKRIAEAAKRKNSHPQHDPEKRGADQTASRGGCGITEQQYEKEEDEEAEGVLRFFCVCAPGLEPLLQRELLALRLPCPSPRFSLSSPVAIAASASPTSTLRLSGPGCREKEQHQQEQHQQEQQQEHHQQEQHQRGQQQEHHQQEQHRQEQLQGEQQQHEHQQQLEELDAVAAATRAAAAANAVRVKHGWAETGKRPGSGGVEVVGPLESLWNICMRSRLVESVRVRVGQPFLASKEETFLKRATRLSWEKYLPLVASLQQPTISVRVHRSRLYHSKMLQELLSTAITQKKATFINQTRRDSLPPSFKGRAAPEVLSTPSHVHLHLNGNMCQISIEAGAELGRRLWRVSRGPTPLRETLAAAVAYRSPFLNLLHTQEKVFVWDPFCGTGPILLEMLGIAAGLPPNSPRRRHPFFNFPIHSPPRFAALLDCLSLSPHPNLSGLELVGTDIDPAQITKANRNLQAFYERMPRSANLAGLGGGSLPCKIKFFQADFSEAAKFVPPGTLIVTNIPYGRRREKNKIKDIYRGFRHMIASREDWAGVYVLSAAKIFSRQGGLKWRSVARFSNGGIEVELLNYVRKRYK